MNAVIKLRNDHLDYSTLLSDFEAAYSHMQNSGHRDISKIIMALYPLRLDIEIHFAREEYALFPNVEHPIIPVLMEEHVILREKLREIDNLIEDMNDDEELQHEEMRIDNLKILIDSFCSLWDSHINKEEDILFPYLLDSTNISRLKFIQNKLDKFDNIAAAALL